VTAAPERTDVIVAGAGPAGSTLAWDLARRGVRVVVLDRAEFPREKVCGDYVEPRGLRVLRAMGCFERLEAIGSVPIARAATHVAWQHGYTGPIPYYGRGPADLPAYGQTFPREVLDAVMLDAARAAGAEVHEGTSVTDVHATSGSVEVTARRAGRSVRYVARLVGGADGANSAVARSQGVLENDERRAAVASRAYAVLDDDGERDVAEFFFDREFFPGYGWMFPAPEGRVNLGVGLLSEARAQTQCSLNGLFDRFVEQLRRKHPRCARLQLVSKPIGGIVRMYGAAGPNHFDGGLLVGEAGRFVDPLTGEGIAPAMESSLLASKILIAALESGDGSAGSLSAYERAFRAYFDPSMLFLDFCAALSRNRHLAGPWLKALAWGYEVARSDPDFALTAGSYFGGTEVRPLSVVGMIWQRSLEPAILGWTRLLGVEARSRRPAVAPAPEDWLEWQVAAMRSLLSDPAWHARWLSDVQRGWTRVLATGGRPDPRPAGLLDASADWPSA
jgi:geranylgeranyl reductase family protein